MIRPVQKIHSHMSRYRRWRWRARVRTLYSTIRTTRQDQRADPDRVEQVREVAPVEPMKKYSQGSSFNVSPGSGASAGRQRAGGGVCQGAILGRRRRGGATDRQGRPEHVDPEGGLRVASAALGCDARRHHGTFARGLQGLDIELFATDGTREHLAQDGRRGRSPSPTSPASRTMLDGQVKTFHHAIYAGILARRDQPDQLEELTREGIEPIDLVVVNVRPFAAEVGRAPGRHRQGDRDDRRRRRGAARRGGSQPARRRRRRQPDHYTQILGELKARGQVSPELRASSSPPEAFGMVAAYHAEIAAYLDQISGTTSPKRLAMVLDKVSDLRYGENPHQTGGVLPRDDPSLGGHRRRAVLQGAPPSFNNLLDLDVAYRIASDYTTPTVVIAKHTDPVGIASGDELVEAYRRALETDPVASFGGDRRGQPDARWRNRARDRRQLVRGGDRAGLRRLGDRHPAQEAGHRAAPGPARPDRGHARLRHRPARLQAGRRRAAGRDAGRPRARRVAKLQVVTKRRPTLEELTDLLFAWRASATSARTRSSWRRTPRRVGIGPGQAEPQVSVEIALRRAGERARLSVMAADAYFPFPDGIQVAARPA